MRTEEHIRHLRESMREIEEAIEMGLTEKQRTLGFHISVASVDMLEIFLHKLGLLDVSQILKHNDFTSKRKALSKLNFDFPHKEKILNLMIEVENKRNQLCYGKRKNKQELEEIVMKFEELKKIFEREGVLDEL